MNSANAFSILDAETPVTAANALPPVTNAGGLDFDDFGSWVSAPEPSAIDHPAKEVTECPQDHGIDRIMDCTSLKLQPGSSTEAVLESDSSGDRKHTADGGLERQLLEPDTSTSIYKFQEATRKEIQVKHWTSDLEASDHDCRIQYGGVDDGDEIPPENTSLSGIDKPSWQSYKVGGLAEGLYENPWAGS